jgi:hypothetical protein
LSSDEPDRAGERSSAEDVLPDTSVQVCEVADRVWDELGRVGDGGWSRVVDGNESVAFELEAAWYVSYTL